MIFGQGHLTTLSIGSGEEDFQRFLPYIGVAAAWSWPGDPDHLVPLSPVGPTHI